MVSLAQMNLKIYLIIFLMMLSGGEPVRKSTGVTKAWGAWHSQTDDIDQLCSVIEEGEELAAIRAMAGQAFLDRHTASSVCDQLLLRWRRTLIQKHSLSEKALAPGANWSSNQSC